MERVRWSRSHTRGGEEMTKRERAGDFFFLTRHKIMRIPEEVAKKCAMLVQDIQ